MKIEYILWAKFSIGLPSMPWRLSSIKFITENMVRRILRNQRTSHSYYLIVTNKDGLKEMTIIWCVTKIGYMHESVKNCTEAATWEMS